MRVHQAIEYLQALQDAGHGEAVLRTYSELSDETYPPARFVLRLAEENEGIFDPTYGTWVEVT